jgi:hypothetical protein
MFKLYQRGTPAAAGRMRPRYSIRLLGLLFLGMLHCGTVETSHSESIVPY